MYYSRKELIKEEGNKKGLQIKVDDENTTFLSLEQIQNLINAENSPMLHVDIRKYFKGKKREWSKFTSDGNHTQAIQFIDFITHTLFETEKYTNKIEIVLTRIKTKKKQKGQK